MIRDQEPQKMDIQWIDEYFPEDKKNEDNDIYAVFTEKWICGQLH